MSDDNNVIHFAGKRVLKLGELSQTVLIVRPDGVKLRGFDMRPVNDLPRDELLSLIDLLCERVMR